VHITLCCLLLTDQKHSSSPAVRANMHHKTDRTVTPEVLDFLIFFLLKKTEKQTQLTIYPSIHPPTHPPIHPSGFITAVAIFWKPNTIPLCFSSDLVPNFLLSWLLVLLLPMLFLGRPLFLLSNGIHSIIN